MAGGDDLNIRVSVLEERSRADTTALDVRTAYLEKRLADLNGEAGRLKTAADLSVTREKFDDYVNTQRLQFDAYKASQMAAFKAYSDEVEKRLGAINVKLATWGGALVVAVAVIQFVLRKT
jgi:hypothetical protein